MVGMVKTNSGGIPRRRRKGLSSGKASQVEVTKSQLAKPKRPIPSNWTLRTISYHVRAREKIMRQLTFEPQSEKSHSTTGPYDTEQDWLLLQLRCAILVVTSASAPSGGKDRLLACNCCDKNVFLHTFFLHLCK